MYSNTGYNGNAVISNADPHMLEKSLFTLLTKENHNKLKVNNKSTESNLKWSIRLPSQAEMTHDENGCCKCDQVANQYLSTLPYINQQDPIQCTRDLYELIWQAATLLLSHREMNSYHPLPWFDIIALNLWSVAKHLKEQFFDSDMIISKYHSNTISLHDKNTQAMYLDGSEDLMYCRLIRTLVYNCRALVSEQANDLNQALTYHRKCVSIKPTLFEYQYQLQLSSSTAIDRISRAPLGVVRSKSKFNSLNHRNWASSSSMSSITFSSDSESSSLKENSVSCTHCGIEKKTMPVCPRCRSQSFCSIRCINLHKSIHVKYCLPF